jgi:hypothetical protein
MTGILQDDRQDDRQRILDEYMIDVIFSSACFLDRQEDALTAQVCADAAFSYISRQLVAIPAVFFTYLYFYVCTVCPALNL